MQENLSVAAQISILAIQFGTILFAARFCGMAASKLRIPSVLGELIAGIIIGPYVLGSLPLPLHGFHGGLFPLVEGSAIPVSLPLYGIATLGSIILLFISGLETDLRMFFRYSLVGTIVGLGGVVFSFAFGAGLGMLTLKTSFMDPRCLFLGILCTATSVGITARILSEKRSIDSPEGTTILAAAVIDDVLGIICLAVVMGIVAAGNAGSSAIAWGKIGVIAVKSFGIWLGVTTLGLVFAHKIASFLKIFKSSVNFSVLAFGLAMLLAGLFEQAGLAMIVGAYVMGLCLSKTDIAFSIQRPMTPVYNLLVPVFFVVMGMMVDIRVMSNPYVLKLGLIYSILAIAAKIIGCALPALFMNFNTIGALRIGAGMIPRGEVALIIAGIGATTMMNSSSGAVPIINAELFGIAIIMTLMTTLAAPPILSAVLSIKKKGVKIEKADTSQQYTKYEFPSDIISEFILRDMMSNFRKEGYRHSGYLTNGIISFRKDAATFSLTIEGNIFTFESDRKELSIIKAVMYETIVGLHQSLSRLKELASPERMDQVLSDVKNNKFDKSIKFDKIISSNSVIFLKGRSKREVFEEMVMRLDEEHKLTDTAMCLNDVLAREEIVSTCIPGGIALPHGRTDGAKQLVSIIGISKDGVNCDAPDGELTHVFVLSVCPKDAHAPYLRYVSQVAQVLNGKDAVSNICKMTDASEIREMFIRRKEK